MVISGHTIGIGRLIALLVFLACFILLLAGKLPLEIALLIGALALAMLIP